MPLFRFIFLDQLPSFYVKIDYYLIYCRKKEIALLYSNTKIYSKWLENSHAFEIICGKNDRYKNAKKNTTAYDNKRKIGQLQGFKVSIL